MSEREVREKEKEGGEVCERERDRDRERAKEKERDSEKERERKREMLFANRLFNNERCYLSLARKIFLSL